MLLSSGDAYSGLTASFHSVEAGAHEIRESATYGVAVHFGRPHRLWDRREGAACVGPHERGDVVTTTFGETRSVKWDRSTSFIALEIAPELVREIAPNPDRLDIAGTFSHRDPSLERLAFSVFREMLAGMPSGPIYGEEIGASVASRLIERAIGSDRVRTRGGLSKTSSSRVVAFMHDAMSERISLADLAKIAGLSTFHFARQFRASMGIAPHAYLMRVRVDEAVRAILHGAKPSDAAAQVGFSSQGHLTRNMRRALGVTPGRLATCR